jgi:hypothetical protein
MARSRSRMAVDEQIAAVLEETGESDPAAAVRAKARELIAQFHGAFGETPPFNMEALASFRGIRPSSEPPAHSPDAELCPDGKGGVLLRLNRNRPVTRQRFSVGHEVTHTFFPGYGEKVQCRKPAARSWADPEDVIETLCDIGASELLFPLPWFADDAERLGSSAQGMADLAEQYKASPEATVRRMVGISKEPVAAVLFQWKLKPAQIKKGFGRKDQPNLFGTDPEEEARVLLKLRVEYSIANNAFDLHIPRDKSVESAGVIYQASAGNCCSDGEEQLDLGPCRGMFRISALPFFTDEDALGTNGEKSVLAVIRPLQQRQRTVQLGLLR